MNWQLISFACCSISTPIATAYDNLGESGLQHSLNEPECAAIFTNGDLLPVVSKVAANVPSLHLVIYDGEADASIVEKIRGARDGIKVFTLDELRELGEKKVNGRQIKNIVKTATALAAGRQEQLSFSHLTLVLDMMDQFETRYVPLTSQRIER